MKKILLFVTFALLSATQIVNSAPVADGPKGHGFLKPSLRGRLEPVELKDAMLTLFAKEANNTEIAEYFQKINGLSFSEMKEVYRESFEEAFGVEDLTDAEMRQIFNNMKFRSAPEGYWDRHQSLYIPKGANTFEDMEWSRPESVRENEQIGSCTYEGVTVDLMTTYCANPVKKDKKPVSKKKVVEEEIETEYVRYPGSKKVIIHEPDTVLITRSRVQIETNNNKVVQFNNNQSFEVDMNQYASNKQYNNSCNCPQQQQRQANCGCDEKRICDSHYEKLPKKHKKNFFNTVGGRVLTHTAAAVGGYFLGRWIFGDGNNNVAPDQIFTQGPFDPEPGPGSNIVFTHGPFN